MQTPQNQKRKTASRRTSSSSRTSKASLAQIVAWCGRILAIDAISDYDGAFNGLQVENRGTVARVAAAVDASFATAELAVSQGANLLVVHHGLFWNSRQPWTGANFRLARFVMDNDLAVFSAHLPLDVHPKLGNNAQLCRCLGFSSLRPFLFTRGQFLGLRTVRSISRQGLAVAIERAVGGRVTILPGGDPICRKIGVVTGGAGSELKLAAKEGVDTFITGEGPHWTYGLAEELGLNVFYAGHYRTETFGVKALAAEISKRFGVPWSFIDHPSGL